MIYLEVRGILIILVQENYCPEFLIAVLMLPISVDALGSVSGCHACRVLLVLPGQWQADLSALPASAAQGHTAATQLKQQIP